MYRAAQVSRAVAGAKPLSYNRVLPTSWCFRRVLSLFPDPSADHHDESIKGIGLVRMLQAEQLLPATPNCVCGKTMSLHQNSGYRADGCYFRCNKLLSSKSKTRRCKAPDRSVRQGTIFSKSKLTLNEIMAVTFMWWKCWPLSRIRDEIPFGNNRTLGKV